MADRAGIINVDSGGIVSIPNALVEVSPGVWQLQAAAPGYVPATRQINTSAPLTGGGDLSANRTLSIPAATGTADGYMTSTQAALVNGATASDTASTLLLRDASQTTAIGALQVDTAPAAPITGGVGKVLWNDSDGTLEFLLKGGSTAMQVGLETVIRVRNDEATPLAAGEVVYINGANGTHVTVKRASASSETTSATTIGIVSEAIAVNADGFATAFGLVHEINTNHLTEGAPVYLSTVAGQTTATAPTAPNARVFLGICSRKNPVHGHIFVAIQEGYELDELHDVLITAPAASQVLMRNAGNTLWENHTLTKADVGLGNVDNTADATKSVLYAATAGGAPPTGAAGGVLAGTYPSPTLAADRVRIAGDTMTGTLNIGPTSASQLFLTGTGNLRFGIGFGSGSFSSANAVVEWKPHANTRLTFYDNVNGGLHNPALAICCIGVGGKGMALFADTTSSAFIFDDAGNFDITSDTKAHIEAGTFGGGTLRFRVTAAGIATATGGMIVSDLTAARPVWATTSGRLTTTPQTGEIVPVTTSATPVSVPATGGHIRVVGSGARAVNLPAGSGVVIGTKVTIKDAAGNASTGTITINANGTDTIDGAATTTITTNYGVVRLIMAAFSGGLYRWEII